MWPAEPAAEPWHGSGRGGIHRERCGAEPVATAAGAAPAGWENRQQLFEAGAAADTRVCSGKARGPRDHHKLCCYILLLAALGSGLWFRQIDKSFECTLFYL